MNQICPRSVVHDAALLDLIPQLLDKETLLGELHVPLVAFGRPDFAPHEVAEVGWKLGKLGKGSLRLNIK